MLDGCCRSMKAGRARDMHRVMIWPGEAVRSFVLVAHSSGRSPESQNQSHYDQHFPCWHGASWRVAHLLYCVLQQGLADPLGWQDITQGIPQLLIAVFLLPPLHILQIAL